MARKKSSRAAKVRNMLDKGVTPKEIALQLDIPAQAVYNIRYQYNKSKGVGSLLTPPIVKDGIASVRRKPGRPRKQQVIVVPTQTEKPEVRISKIEGTVRETTSTLAWLIVAMFVAILLVVLVNAGVL